MWGPSLLKYSDNFMTTNEIFIYLYWRTNFNCDTWFELNAVKEFRSSITAQFYSGIDKKTRFSGYFLICYFLRLFLKVKNVSEIILLFLPIFTTFKITMRMLLTIPVQFLTLFFSILKQIFFQRCFGNSILHTF